MSKVLTPNEVDTLLAAISSKDIPDNSVEPKKTKKHIKIYDFKRPDKLNINDVKNIANVMEYFAKSFANNLNETHVCDKKFLFIYYQLTSLHLKNFSEVYHRLTLSKLSRFLTSLESLN